MDPNVDYLEDFSTAVVSGGVSATLLSLVFMAGFSPYSLLWPLLFS